MSERRSLNVDEAREVLHMWAVSEAADPGILDEALQSKEFAAIYQSAVSLVAGSSGTPINEVTR